MSSSLKMARLDYFTFKSQFVSHAVLVLMIIMFSIMGFSFITLGITVAWFVALLSMNIFAVQEKNEIEQLYISLPFIHMKRATRLYFQIEWLFYLSI